MIYLILKSLKDLLYLFERQRRRNRDLPSTGSRPKWLQRLRLSPVEASALQLQLGLSCGGPKYLDYLLQIFQIVNRELHWT